MADNGRPPLPLSPAEEDTGRLESWKEVAAYLKRDVRTVQRWEKRERLPVHRHVHGKLGSVYAYKAELDDWWKNGTRLQGIEQDGGPEEDESPAMSNLAHPGRRTERIFLAAVLGLAVAATGFFVYRRPGSPPQDHSLNVRALTTLPGAEMAPSFSPDGKQVAFAWNGPDGNGFDLYTRSIDSQELRQVTTQPSRAVMPAWSPDGRELSFLRCSESGKGVIGLIPLTGGPENVLFETECDADYQWQNLAWSSSGEFLVYNEKFRGGDSYRVILFSLKTGHRQVLSSPPPGFQDVFPIFSPDGRTVAFYRCVHADCRIHTVEVSGSEPKALFSRPEVIDGGLAWMPGGKSIVAAIRRNNAHELWSFPVPSGEPRLLYSSPVDHILYAAISPTGKQLVFPAVHYVENIWRAELSRGGKQTQTATRFIASSRGEEFPQYSPDGSKIAFQSIRSGTWEVWACDRNGENPLQLTQTEQGNSIYPRWSPDSKYIVYDSRRAGHSSVFVINAEGGRPEPIDTEDMDAEVPSFSPDGNWIYLAAKREKSWQIWKVPRGGGPAQQITQDGGYGPIVSSDNRWIYYAKGNGAPGIWRVPVQGGAEELVIAELEPHFYADWTLFSSGIYFLNAGVRPSAVEFFDIQSRRRTPIRTIDSVHSWSDGLSISPDGRWLLFPQVERLQSDLMLLDVPTR